MTGRPGKTTRIAQLPSGDLYWNENSHSWEKMGSYYKSTRHAQAAIARHKLTNCTPVDHG